MSGLRGIPIPLPPSSLSLCLRLCIIIITYKASLTGALAMYIDLHAHCNTRGCFLYGNALEDLDEQVTPVHRYSVAPFQTDRELKLH